MERLGNYRAGDYIRMSDLKGGVCLQVAEVAGQAAMKVSTKLVDKASAARRSLSQDAEITRHWNVSS